MDWDYCDVVTIVSEKHSVSRYLWIVTNYSIVLFEVHVLDIASVINRNIILQAKTLKAMTARVLLW